MEKEIKTWRSPSLGCKMDIKITGGGGTPILHFPTTLGDLNEAEDQGFTESINEQLEKGYNQLFTVNHVFDDSFNNGKVDPYTRVLHHMQYEKYIFDEVIPFIEEENASPFLILSGCEFGAYLALLISLKHPKLTGKVIAMSGDFDIKKYMDGFYDDNVYYNNPVDFIPNLHDEKVLSSVRDLNIHLASYTNDIHLNSTRRMSDTLWMKFIEHEYDVWGQETQNGWTVWNQMIKAYII